MSRIRKFFWEMFYFQREEFLYLTWIMKFIIIAQIFYQIFHNILYIFFIVQNSQYFIIIYKKVTKRYF